MKRVWAALLLTAAALALVLYSGRQPAETGEETEDLIVVGMSQVGAESDWRVANSESMKAVFTEESGYRLLFEDAKQKPENQFSSIRRFIQQQVDYIVVMPVEESGWDSVLQEASAAGIPVIVVDRKVDVQDETLITARVGADFYAEGMEAVRWMEQTYKDPAQLNIIHIQGTHGSTAQIGRTQALEDGLAAHETWNLLTRMDGDFTRAKTYEAMTAYLESCEPLPQIHVVYCENDNEAFGAIQALEAFGYTCGKDAVAVISFDATREALEYCRQGKISLTVECDPLLGPLVEEVIRDMEAGKAPEKERHVKVRAFRQEDITDALLEGRQY